MTDALVQKQGGREVVLERQRACRPGSSCARTLRATDTTTSRRPLHRASGTWASWTPWYVAWPCPGICHCRSFAWQAPEHVCLDGTEISLCICCFTQSSCDQALATLLGQFQLQHAGVLMTVTAGQSVSLRQQVCQELSRCRV